LGFRFWLIDYFKKGFLERKADCQSKDSVDLICATLVELQLGNSKRKIREVNTVAFLPTAGIFRDSKGA
jgi:hypothetical protein